MDQSRSSHSDKLEQAFHVFNEVCQQLEASYRVLEARVALLNQELAAARDERLRQLIEKERIGNRLRCLLDALPAGVVVVGGDDTVLECNPVAEGLLQTPLVGRHWDDVAKGAFLRVSEPDQEACLKDGRIVSLSMSPLEIEAGRIILIKDVTETRSLQEMANRHKRLTAMGEMAATLAHQIRTPLATALLYASHLHRQSAASREQEGPSARILASLRYLEHLVNDMLAFARGGSFRADQVEISTLLDELYQGIEPQLRLHNCTLEIEDGSRQAVLRGNRTALLGALQNVVTNAVQACTEGPASASGDGARAWPLKVEARLVEVRESVPYVELAVIDRGPGIPGEVLDHIFEPFFTTRRDGTGLGLAVVQAIVHAHEGTVVVNSRPGSGTTVTIRLPFYSASALGGEEALSDGANSLSEDTRPAVLRGEGHRLFRYG